MAKKNNNIMYMHFKHVNLIIITNELVVFADVGIGNTNNTPQVVPI